MSTNHFERSENLKGSLSTIHLERSMWLMLLFSTNQLELIERLKLLYSTNHLEHSKRLQLSSRDANHLERGLRNVCQPNTAILANDSARAKEEAYVIPCFARDDWLTNNHSRVSLCSRLFVDQHSISPSVCVRWPRYLRPLTSLEVIG